ncbi:MAG TPA: helix-turn-helix transcriptional regulator [Rectinemataceae bacterium]
MDYVRECFSANLKLRRAALGISQETLAELSGLSPGYIANLETGRSFPSTPVLLKIAGALKVEHWRLLVDPRKEEISYTRSELTVLWDRAKDLILGGKESPYGDSGKEEDRKKP